MGGGPGPAPEASGDNDRALQLRWAFAGSPGETHLPVLTMDETNLQVLRDRLLVEQRNLFYSRSRNTIDEPFSTSDNAISFTVRRFYK